MYEKLGCIVRHPLHYKQGQKVRFTHVQTITRAFFIAKFWANKYQMPVTITNQWGYEIVKPDTDNTQESV